MKFLLSLWKYICLFLIGGLSYCGIEVLFRGYTHWTMGILGGICFILCGLVNNIFTFEMPLAEQMGICSVLITLSEFIAGLILNVHLGLGIWDYSDLPFNIMGQVCLPFMLAWFFLSLVAIVVDDLIRWKWFDEECPHYHLVRWGVKGHS